MRRGVVVVMFLFVAVPALAGEPKTVRVGINNFNGQPYNGCSYLEVTGPLATKALILKRAKEQYKEPSAEALAAVADRVLIRVVTSVERSCSDEIPKEIIFVNKKTDSPVLRAEMEQDVTVLQNGLGATWASTDGVAVVSVDEFRKGLAEGKSFKVLVVLKSGSTREIRSGIGYSTWTDKHTEKVLAGLVVEEKEKEKE